MCIKSYYIDSKKSFNFPYSFNFSNYLMENFMPIIAFKKQLKGLEFSLFPPYF